MPDIKTAVITGGHSYEVLLFHELFRSLPGVDAYIQHLEDFASSSQAVRASYDVLVFYIMPRGAPSDQGDWFSGPTKTALEEIALHGQGIVLLHHAVLAYSDWPLWDQIVGMKKRVIRSYRHDQKIPVELADPAHPILDGIRPWTITDETYAIHEPAADNHILLTTTHPESMHSLAWTRRYRDSRVFCFPLGHDHAAYQDTNFRRILAQGICWVHPQGEH